MGKISAPSPEFGSNALSVKRYSSLTVVGIGNDLRSDDAVGLMVLRELKHLLPPEVKAAELTDDQLGLIDLMQPDQIIIIIDAVRSSSPVGTIFRLNAASEPIPKNFFSFSTHSIDTVQAIEMARAMGRLPECVIVYGIAGRDFSFSSQQSPEVIDAAKVVRSRILEDIRLISAECRSESGI